MVPRRGTLELLAAARYPLGTIHGADGRKERSREIQSLVMGHKSWDETFPETNLALDSYSEPTNNPLVV